MDPHFREYLAAVAGMQMQEVYGFNNDDADVRASDVRIECSHEVRPAAAEAVPGGAAGR